MCLSQRSNCARPVVSSNSDRTQNESPFSSSVPGSAKVKSSINRKFDGIGLSGKSRGDSQFLPPLVNTELDLHLSEFQSIVLH